MNTFPRPRGPSIKRSERTILRQAIVDARSADSSKHLFGETGDSADAINVDTAALLLRQVEASRALNVNEHCSETLRQVVGRTVASAGFAPDRRRAYEFVLMRYYSTLSTFQADVRKAQARLQPWRGPKKAKKKRPATPLVLEP